MNYEDYFDLGPETDPLSDFEGMDTVSAARLLTVTDGLGAEAMEEVFLRLEEENIPIDLSDLPLSGASGEAARRLREEEQLVRSGKLLAGLEENDPLGVYLRELASIPACGDPELLALELLEGRDVANRLVDLSLGRVVELAQEYTGRGVLLLDLIQEGSLGLWNGILRFTGGSFESFRDGCIRRYMAQAVIRQARASGLGQ